MSGEGPRIGLLGGTFDPPHIGHLSVAVEVRWALHLDRVRMVVANDPWQKRGSRPITPAADRLAMVRAAVAGLEGIEADGREIRRGGPSYTVDTVQELLAEAPSAEVVVVLGADAAALLDTWERAEELAGLARIAVVRRPGYPAVRVPDGFRWDEVLVPALDVSSSDLRARLGAGRPIDVLVPAPAATWIAEHRIYPGPL